MALILIVSFAPLPYDALTVEEVYQHYQAGDAVFIDTRTLYSYNIAHIPGALWITPDNITENLHLLPSNKSKLIISYCDCPSGGTAVQALEKLEKEGYTNLAFLNARFSVDWNGNPDYPVESGTGSIFLEKKRYYERILLASNQRAH